MADDIREARRLAKLVCGTDHPVNTRKSVLARSDCAEVLANGDGRFVGYTVYAPTRRAALAGLCAALRVMVKEGEK